MAGVCYIPKDLSIDHPLRMRSDIVVRLMPVFSDHIASVIVCPLAAIMRLFDLLFCCALYVAHTQLSGVYPRSLFTRSMVYFLDGQTPMSDKNLSNESQELQIVMPRPPYLWNAGEFLFKHLVFIPHQALCVLVWLMPWVTLPPAFSLRRHPHDLEYPFLNDDAVTIRSEPQEQTHSHCELRDLLLNSWRRITSHLLNVLPVRSCTTFDIPKANTFKYYLKGISYVS